MTDLTNMATTSSAVGNLSADSTYYFKVILVVTRERGEQRAGASLHGEPDYFCVAPV